MLRHLVYESSRARRVPIRTNEMVVEESIVPTCGHPFLAAHATKAWPRASNNGYAH